MWTAGSWTKQLGRSQLGLFLELIRLHLRMIELLSFYVIYSLYIQRSLLGSRVWGGRLYIDLGLWAILYISTMAAQKKKNVAIKRRILTKREKVQKRVTRVHKAIERKRHERQKKKKSASSIRRRLAEV